MSLSVSALSKIKKTTTFQIDSDTSVPCFDFVTGEVTELPAGNYAVVGDVEGFASRVLVSNDTGEIFELSRRLLPTLTLSDD